MSATRCWSCCCWCYDWFSCLPPGAGAAAAVGVTIGSRVCHQVLELLLLVLHECRRDNEEKWKRLSRQITDSVLPLLCKQQASHANNRRVSSIDLPRLCIVMIDKRDFRGSYASENLASRAGLKKFDFQVWKAVESSYQTIGCVFHVAETASERTIRMTMGRALARPGT